jgi:hypothetical protein
MRLPVIICAENGDIKNPGPCNTVVGAVEIDVLYLVEANDKIEDDAPYEMALPEGNDYECDDIGVNDNGAPAWIAPLPNYADPDNPTKKEQVAYGEERWESFVSCFNMLGPDIDDDGSPDRPEWPNDAGTIFFAPDCDFHQPKGNTGARNFGIRARAPVLVD